ncbi:RE1 [Symbiodinium sp. CCMP2592]|nr:RE1 [Symbiodinium sp. CCMP2592]
MTSGGEGSKAHEGPPSWDGDAGSFQEYEESSLLWEQSVAYEKRYLCGPKLAAALKGVHTLMQHLRAALGRPQISDLTDYLSKYFKGSRRRNNEDINSYIARKSEIYLRACQALQRVSPLQPGETNKAKGRTSTSWAPSWNSSRRSSYDYTPAEEATEDQDEAPATEATTASTEDRSWSYWQRGQWNYGHQEWGYSWWGSPWYNHWTWNKEPVEEAPAMPELLPNYVQGWYLLHDSGLTAQEKNSVQTALQGDFRYDRVAQELRNQCAVLDGQRREYHPKNSGYMGELYDEEPDEDETQTMETDPILEAEHQEEWHEAEEDAQSALAAINQGRRTLKEARQRQNNVRLARQYFRTNSGAGQRDGGKGRDEKMTCLRCGRTGHRVANCPDPPTAAAKSAEPVAATSSFVCFCDQPQALTVEQSAEDNSNYMQAMMSGISTADAVSQGKAVIDGGATKTLASINAMERIMQLNNLKSGHSGLISVDTTERSTASTEARGQCGSYPRPQLAKGSMPKATKEDLRMELMNHGEVPPQSWTMVELNQRLRELREQGLLENEEASPNSTMEKMLKDLRRASKLKANLTKYCTEVLKLELTGNEVMAKMIDKATKEIRRVCPAEANDLAGFGKHANERYVAIATQYQDYATWVKTTFQESGEDHVDPRLARLAKWLLQMDRKPTPKAPPVTRKEQGYMKMQIPSTSSHVSGRAGSSRASTDPTSAQAVKMMQEMAEAMESMRQELAEVKGQRPRKTAGNTEEGQLTDGQLSPGQARALERQAWSVVPDLFQSLVGFQRPCLMECACEADNLLASTVQSVAKREDAVTQCYLNNGCDLSTDEGVRLVLSRIEVEQPQHIWLRPPSGPFSPMQGPNQANKEQAENLKEKRRHAMRVFVGCACVIHCAVQKGIHVTFELADRSDAWYLVLGVYAYGNHYGVTKVTRQLPQTCQYILQYLQHWSQDNIQCSSIIVNDNCQMQVHRDVNNLPHTLNHLIGVTPYQHGEMWLEGPSTNPNHPSLNLQLPTGEYKSGHLRRTRHQVVPFDARKWHATQPWHGHRVTVGGYTSRGVLHLSVEDVQWLKACGFQWQEGRQGAEARAVFRGEAKKGSNVEEEIKRKLYLLHAATGHGSTRNLVEALKRRHVDPLVLRLAEEFQCPICHERKKAQPRQLASLEPLPPKFHTITADIGHWNCPHSGETQNFMMVVDEGSRFRVAKILTKGNKQTPNAATCLNFLSEGWIQIFGKPRALRLDPAGSFRSASVENFCDRNEIYLDIIPGEAHWQIGTVENAIQGLKTVMTKLSAEDPSLSAEQVMSLPFNTFNQRELVRGFSPVHHVLGSAPDETGRHLHSERPQPPDVILNQLLQDFRKEAELRASAEKALVEWQAQQRVSRAVNSRTRPSHLYHPGDLVYFWRTQESGRGKRSPNTTQGRFLGPARILAMETRRSTDDEPRPAHSVWVVRGRHLMKCSPEQLRPASQREELVESLATRDQTPWTYMRLAEEIGGSQYEDISTEVPSEQEWQRAQDVQEEVSPPRTRIRGKRAAPLPDEDLDLEDPEAREPSQPSNIRRVGQPPGPRHDGLSGEKWQASVAESAWAAEETCYWAQEEAAVAIEIEVPQSNRGWEKFLNNPQAYFVGALRRRAVEVSEKRLTAEDRVKFQEAKAKEVRNFIAAQAFEALPDHLKPSKDQAIGMRWLLTWKTQDDGSVRPEARAILLGYQDPNYEFRSTTSPVMSRQTRQLFLQAAANRHWRIQNGDITGAFLQGREYPSELFCIPCDEILESMNLPAGTVTRLKRACYGLVDAPLEWYRTIAEFLESIGLTRLWSDAWSIKMLVTGHVDDFLFGGSEEDQGWQEIIRLIKEKFRWGDWDQDKFVQCGVQIETTSDGFTLSQPHYLSNLEEIHINATRRKDRKAETTEWEKTQLRALLGGLSWFAQQTGPHLAAEVSMMLSAVCESRVETIIEANLLLQHAKERKNHFLQIFRHKDEDMQFYAWVDAANKNRAREGSTQGVFIGASSKQLLQGAVCAVCPMSWSSTKIDRSCRSPGSAETQAAVNGEDSLFYMRYQWAEMQFGKVNLQAPSETVKQVDGCLITDSRNVYDKLSTEVLTVQGAEKKANLELLSAKESQMSTNLKVRWVHSEAQLANALTKKGGKELELYYKMRFMWRIVEDPAMRSARRRRQEGLQPFDQTQVSDNANETPETQGSGGHASD